MFDGGDQVEVLACEDYPPAKGRIGHVLDQAEPGPLTQHRWAVAGVGPWGGSVLCRSDELKKTGQ